MRDSTDPMLASDRHKSKSDAHAQARQNTRELHRLFETAQVVARHPFWPPPIRLYRKDFRGVTLIWVRQCFVVRAQRPDRAPPKSALAQTDRSATQYGAANKDGRLLPNQLARHGREAQQDSRAVRSSRLSLAAAR